MVPLFHTQLFNGLLVHNRNKSEICIVRVTASVPEFYEPSVIDGSELGTII